MRYRLTRDNKRTNKVETVYSVQTKNKRGNWITALKLVINKFETDNTTLLRECTFKGRYIYFNSYKTLLGGHDFKHRVKYDNGLTQIDDVDYSNEFCYTVSRYPVLDSYVVVLADSDILYMQEF